MPRKRSVPSLAHFREQIDHIDAQILTLVNRRAGLAVQIGHAKQQRGASAYVPSREQQIFARLATLNRGPLPNDAIQAIYREIISASRALEQKLRVAYFGPAATYTHMAAREQFGAQATFVPLSSIPQVFAEVERTEADYGVVPIENSSEGAVAITLDTFVESPLKIIAERSLGIRHCLLSRAARLERVERVLAHPQALAQCRRWLALHLPGVPTEEVASNARAAELAVANSRVAAIAGRLAGEHYKLKILAANIQDQAANFTRFAILGRESQPSQATGQDKTSLLLSVRDEVGVLYHTLQPFAEQAINLLRIESRPLKGRPWEYVFFIDVEGHVTDEPLAQALRLIEPRCSLVKVLGSYARANHRLRSR
ncbi:MAG: prephenate dehydratase [Candidatus Binatia bacterium]